MMAIGEGSFFLKVKKTPNVQAEVTDIIFLLFLIFSGRIPIGELDNSNGTGFQLTCL